jgi:phage baseplate assembly protein W
MSILSLLPVTEGGEAQEMGDLTWELADGRAVNKISGADALCQAIRLMLEVPRYRHMIYSWQYGSELDGLVGGSIQQVHAKAPEMIRQALLIDDRVQDVTDFSIRKSADSDAVDIDFIVHTADGLIQAGWSVDSV